MATEREKRDKQTGWAISLAIHSLIVLLFFLINAWKAPDPPLPEYGIELNFGTIQEGFGRTQPRTQPVVSQEPEQSTPQQQETTPQEEVSQVPESAAKPTVVEDDIPDSKQIDSPVKAKPEEKPAPKEPVKEVKKEETKPQPEKVVEKPVEAPKVEEKKVVDTKALYPGSAGQGNQPKQAGDAGDPKGSVDAQALHGKPGGGGGGPSLELAGWRWNAEPKVNDPSKENGKIVFLIEVDSNGDVTKVTTEESNLTPSVARLYRDAVYKLTFSPTSGNPPPRTTGKITFIIRSN